MAITVRSEDIAPDRTLPRKGIAVLEEGGLDVAIVAIEVEHAFGLVRASCLHDGAEQLILVLEIDVERALGDAGRLGDIAHAGGIEAARHEHRAGALDDLPPFGAVFGRFGGRAIPAASGHKPSSGTKRPALKWLDLISESVSTPKVYMGDPIKKINDRTVRSILTVLAGGILIMTEPFGQSEIDAMLQRAKSPEASRLSVVPAHLDSRRAACREHSAWRNRFEATRSERAPAPQLGYASAGAPTRPRICGA